jgi:uncharacterized protein
MIVNMLKACAAIAAASAFSFAHAGSYEDFFVAIRNDNASNLAGLLARGFDPNTRDEKGRPGLAIALQERSTKTAKLLLGQPGIDVDALNQAGESPLMIAALKGDLAGAQGLLERGAKVNQPGWSALHYAASGPEPKVVRLLVERGAAIDAASPNDTTPLMMAAQYGSEESVDLLLARGADPARRNQKGLAAADFAKLAGRESLTQRLAQAPSR